MMNREERVDDRPSPIASGGTQGLERPPGPSLSSVSVETTYSGLGLAGPNQMPGPSATGPEFELREEIAAGQILFNRYQIVQLLGKGGMGEVWLARHLELNCERALKFIRPQIALDSHARHRFKREAQMLAGFVHHNLVVVHDARLGAEAAFIDMEYIRGTSLDKILQSGEPMPLDWTARILSQLCEVLQEAHDRNIVHRDLKPGNLMLVDGRPRGKEFLKVLDFGIAKILGHDNQDTDGESITQGFVGTYHYASPEQINEEEIDGRSDLYSVGVVLYEFLTGHRPFTGLGQRVGMAHLMEAPPAFREKNPDLDLSEEIERVVLRCLAKKPEDRYHNARDLWEDFYRALPPMSGFGSSLIRATVGGPHPGTSSSNFEVEAKFHSQDPISAPLKPEVDLPVTGKATAIAPPVTEPGTGVLIEEKPLETTSPTHPRRGWRRVLVTLTGLGLIGALAAFAFLLIDRKNAKPTPPERQDTDVPPTSLLAALYQPESGTDWIDGWPSVVVRKADQTRFLLIDGSEKFLMGAFDPEDPKTDDSETPAHIRLLSRFYLQETEVTIGEIEDFIGTQGITREPSELRDYLQMYHEIRSFLQRYMTAETVDEEIRGYPAVGISRRLAEEYAHSIGGELPTEAQWEFGARSRGQTNTYVWGNNGEGLFGKLKANVFNNAAELPLIRVKVPAKIRKDRDQFWEDRTEQGVFDMAGSLREWCRDVWRPYRRTVLEKDFFEPPFDEQANVYVIRGGSFDSPREAARTTYRRDREGKDFTNIDLGFRVVLEVPKEVPSEWRANRRDSIAFSQPEKDGPQ